MQGTAVLMEEYVDGTEFFVNGQVDAKGNVSVVAIFEYVRRAANGCHNIDFETLRLPHSSPLFGDLARYTEQVMRATGLLRSPFHLELKADERGPCLIEVGARLAGHGNAFLCGELHGSSLDLIDLAGHYYLHDADYGSLPLDWLEYDSSAVRYVHGVGQNRERLYDLQGVAQVEALPEFYTWVRKPVVGMQVEPTTDSLGMPWSLILKSPTELLAAQAAIEVRRLIRWNINTSVAQRAAIDVKLNVQGYATRLRIRAGLSLPPLRGKDPSLHRASHLITLWPNAVTFMKNGLDAAVRRFQLWRFTRQRADPPEPPQTAMHVAQADSVLEWVREYLARPHPELKRNGPICPFVLKTVHQNCLKISIHDACDGSSMRQLRGIVLDHAAAFRRRWLNDAPHGTLASLVLVFPELDDSRLGILDRIHGELKTHLMCHDLMFSPFHPQSMKPSISNPDFKPFRAPFAALVIRQVDLRDIVFLGYNRDAFLRYRERFSTLFNSGKVRDDYGHVRMYQEACERFGLASSLPSP
jgi:hypothetical protein